MRNRTYVWARLLALLIFITVLASCTGELPSGIPADTLGNGGQFVASCEITHRLNDDPIVHPGEPGAAHSHDFFGSDSADAFSTVSSLQLGSSSCPDRPGDTAAYWLPTLYADGQPITPRRIRVYYRNGGKTPASVQPFPPGLKMIAGDGRATSPQPISVASWACTIRGGGSAGDEKEVQHVPVCPSDSPALRLRIVFPDCWDGVNLDSPDHKSHMAYHVGARCPTSHPVPVPQITMGIRYWYGDNGFQRTSKVMLASHGQYSGHADFFNAWDQENLDALVRECINAAVDCGDAGGPSPTPSRLMVSYSPDRAKPLPLQGATVSGETYVFWEPKAKDVRRVRFFVDGTYIRSDTVAPYDLARRSSAKVAQPFVFNPGRHEIKWVATYMDGTQREGHAHFTVPVGNGSSD